MEDNKVNDLFSSFSTCSILINQNMRPRQKENGYSFVVENNKKPELKHKLRSKDKKSADDICNNFFFNPESSLSRGKELQIINSSFEEEDFYEAGDCPFIEAYRISYLHHFPIVINPNIFWLMILQGFSKHMEINDNSERNRFKFVDFKKQKRITIETGLNIFKASNDQWQLLIDKLLAETSRYIKPNIMEIFNEKFSTSTREEEIATNVTILSIFKKYFKYTMKGTCGISKIRIEGTIEDWKLLLKKTKEIGYLDEEIVFWTDEIKKIINKIIETLTTHKPDIDFYKNIVQNRSRMQECKPDIVNGWIIKFIPYDIDNRKCEFNSPEFNGLSIDRIPSQIVCLPFNLQKKYEAEIYSGFFGITQDEKTLEIKPVIGYSIVLVKKKQENKDNSNEQMRQFQLEFQRGMQLNNNFGRLQQNFAIQGNNAFSNNTFRDNAFINNPYGNNIFVNNGFGNNAFGNINCYRNNF